VFWTIKQEGPFSIFYLCQGNSLNHQGADRMGVIMFQQTASCETDTVAGNEHCVH